MQLNNRSRLSLPGWVYETHQNWCQGGEMGQVIVHKHIWSPAVSIAVLPEAFPSTFTSTHLGMHFHRLIIHGDTSLPVAWFLHHLLSYALIPICAKWVAFYTFFSFFSARCKWLQEVQNSGAGRKNKKIACEKVISFHKINFLPLALYLEYDRENIPTSSKYVCTVPSTVEWQ